MRELSVAIYAACVDFMLNLAALLGVTYRDSNALVLLVAFPLITFTLAAWCTYQRIALRRLPRARR
jgi:hypothetical protein